MTRTIEKAKLEAIKRMMRLNLHPNVLADFKEDMLNKSESLGFLYWLTAEELTAVMEFEEEHDAIVYHVIYQSTNFGELYSFLYVKLDDEEWEQDNEGLKQREVLAYVWNKNVPEFSEFGCIGIRPQFGGLVRTW